jgi:hypothetical protein
MLFFHNSRIRSTLLHIVGDLFFCEREGVARMVAGATIGILVVLKSTGKVKVQEVLIPEGIFHESSDLYAATAHPLAKRKLIGQPLGIPLQVTEKPKSESLDHHRLVSFQYRRFLRTEGIGKSDAQPKQS